MSNTVDSESNAIVERDVIKLLRLTHELYQLTCGYHRIDKRENNSASMTKTTNDKLTTITARKKSTYFNRTAMITTNVCV